MTTIENNLIMVDGKIVKLNKEEYSRLKRERLNYSYDRIWCIEHGVDYFNPNMRVVDALVYKEIFPKKYALLQTP